VTAARLAVFTALPDPVIELLSGARTADRYARGPERRLALAFTRGVIGGARAAGYPVAGIAACLGVSEGSVRDRAAMGAWLAADRLQAALGPGSPADLLVRQQLGSPDPARAGYPAVDVVRALAASATEVTDLRIQGVEK
jgi:hypothetical protein